ncbi:ATP-binding protein [Geobacter pelophilus]|uniref:ATP-binding protein n=1 Tax=Geoanaerobacter pelophilus TaxID=60036 RepID=A0AAW4L0V9_9BACT|nr:ATP-binding protein [Geoanaerobacter pelophilus]MBT0664498.1 ATP-binding protein [Geoanaerobacter pelophilus]
MARVVSEIEKKPVIGRQLFDIVTSGMYDNPLMIYREYIQNSVDSIDLAVESGLIDQTSAHISITLSGHDRSITIEDNGQGLDNDIAHSVLTNIGCSPKEGTNQRGFRGIGRLGGLAYCDELIFETRSKGDELVSVVRWNRKEFDSIAADTQRNITLSEMIQSVATLEYDDVVEETPDHFFRVTIRNVHRFHSDMLMNFKSVNDYLAHSAPVSYNHEVFLHAPAIHEYLSEVSDYRCYRILVNGREVFRPYADEVKLSTNSSDFIQGIEYFQFKGTEGQTIALGWYARTQFLATLPNTLNVKGIRIRQGNIEVGGEHCLDDKFSEPRFSGWQFGEIHVVDNSLKPNARRDGFEHTPNFERFLEQAHALGRHLSSACRKSSNVRIASARIQGSLEQLEKLINDPLTYIDEEHYHQAIENSRLSLSNLEKVAVHGISDEMKSRLDMLREKMESFDPKPVLLEHVLDGRKLKHIDSKELLKHVAKTIVANYSTSKKPEDILQQIFADFTNSTYANHKMNGVVYSGK